METENRVSNNVPTGSSDGFRTAKVVLATIGAMSAILYGSDVYIKAKVESYAASKEWVSNRISELAPTLKSSTLSETDIVQLKKDLADVKAMIKGLEEAKK